MISRFRYIGNQPIDERPPDRITDNDDDWEEIELIGGYHDGEHTIIPVVCTQWQCGTAGCRCGETYEIVRQSSCRG